MVKVARLLNYAVTGYDPFNSGYSLVGRVYGQLEGYRAQQIAHV